MCFSFIIYKGLLPVSYTHLDVYKRQTFTEATIINIVFPPFPSDGGVKIMVLKGCAAISHTNIAKILLK